MVVHPTTATSSPSHNLDPAAANWDAGPTSLPRGPFMLPVSRSPQQRQTEEHHDIAEHTDQGTDQRAGQAEEHGRRDALVDEPVTYSGRHSRAVPRVGWSGSASPRPWPRPSGWFSRA